MVKNFLLLLTTLFLLMANTSALAQFVFYLSPSPQRSNCSGSNIYACEQLDSIEESGYQMARAGKITWLEMVDRFYNERSKFFPQMRDTNDVAEIRSYQRVLAERKDAGKITEAEWVFLLNRQQSALAAREARVQSSIDANNSIQQQMQMQRQQMQQQQQQQQMQMQAPAPGYFCNRVGPNYICNPQ